MKKSILDNNEIYELPYEKLASKGSETLTDGELLAVILQTGSQGMNVLELASKVLSFTKNYGPGLTGIHGVSLEELMQLEGIGRVKAIKLKAIDEISQRIWRTYAHNSLTFDSPKSIADYYMESFRHEPVEKVLLILLNQKMGYLGEHLLSTGTVNLSVLSPRDVLIAALKKQAVHMILLHNHPSGDPTPSEQDIDISERIYQIGEMVDIHLQDHIIIGDHSYVSLRELGFFQGS